MNTWKRKAPALLAVLLLSVPSAVGVFRALAPTRGPWAAGAAAAGFELVYLSTALLILSGDLRKYGRNVAVGAVSVAVVLNALADYSARVPGGLESWSKAVDKFDGLMLLLSIVESAPLAVLAYALATLLHRLADRPEDPAPPPDVVHADMPTLAYARLADPPHYPMPEMARMSPPPEVGAMPAKASTKATKAFHACPACGGALASAGAYGAAQRWGHCKACKPA